MVIVTALSIISYEKIKTIKSSRKNRNVYVVIQLNCGMILNNL